MNEHPISDLFSISMENIKAMIDGNTIVGDIVTINNVTIIPISKLKCSFATGGTDQFSSYSKDEMKYPFGGATGGSVNIAPVAFLVITNEEVKLLHLEEEVHIYEKLLDEIPDYLSSIKELFKKNKEVADINYKVDKTNS